MPALLDPGAQAERTALAWQRTGLGLIGVGAVLLHVGGLRLLSLTAGLLDIAMGVVLGAAVAPMRYRRALLAVGADSSPLARRSCLLVAMCTVVSCLAASADLLQTL